MQVAGQNVVPNRVASDDLALSESIMQTPVDARRATPRRSCDRGDLQSASRLRAVPGFRDHSLKGEWQGYRAVRLSDAYRAIYTIHSEGWVEAVYVEEVNKHD